MKRKKANLLPAFSDNTVTESPAAISRGNFLTRLLAGSTVIAACSLCSLSAQVIPGTRPGAKPQGNGCCKHKHCRYFQSTP